MKKLISTIFAAGALAISAQATVNFSLDIELLRSGGGTALSNSGLLVLVVDADNDGIDLPSAGSYGEDVVASWDLSNVGPGSTAITLFTKGGVEIEPDWNVDEKLALVWFPELSDGELPSATEPYGIFSDNLGVGSGDPWLMPADGTLLHRLKFFSSDAMTLSSYGEFPADAGLASFSVDSPPATISSPSNTMVASSGTGEAIVSWDAPSSTPAGGYVIARRVGDSGSFSTIGFADGSATNFSDSSVSGGIQYEYRVYALEGASFLSATSPSVEFDRSRIVALACRAVVGVPGDVIQNRGIGIKVAGSEPLPVLIQGAGATLRDQWEGTFDIVSNIDMQMYYGSEKEVSEGGEIPDGQPRLIAENSDWDADASVGLDILSKQDKYDMDLLNASSGDPSILASYAPNQSGYAARVFQPDAGSNPGIVSVQAYDVNWREDTPADARLSALASRGFAGTDQGILTGSFIVSGEFPLKLMIRGNGPLLNVVLAGSGIDPSEMLADPTLLLLKLDDSDPNNIRWIEFDTNDNWGTRSDGVTTDEIKAMVSDVGLPQHEDGSNDAFIVGDFEAGIYSAQLRGVGATTGVGQIEIYEVINP